MQTCIALKRKDFCEKSSLYCCLPRASERLSTAMDPMPDLSAERIEHSSNVSVEEYDPKALHSVESLPHEVKEDVLDEPRHALHIVSTDTCGEAETLVAPSLSIAAEGDEGGKDDHLHDHLSTDEKSLQEDALEGSRVLCGVLGDDERNIASSHEKALQEDGMEGNKILRGVMGDDKSSDIASADKEALQEHGMEGNTVLCGVMADVKSSNIASADSCIEAETLIEQSVSISEGCNIEGNSGEKDDPQHSSFVCLLSIEKSKEVPDYLPCCEANLEQETMSAIQVGSELDNTVDDFLGNNEPVESHDPVFETVRLGEDEETKAGAEDPVINFVEIASDVVQSVGECKVSDVAVCRGTFSDVAGCKEVKARPGSKDADTGGLCSLAVLSTPKAIQDEHAKHVLLALNEEKCLVLQGLPSEPDDKAPQGGAVQSFTHGQNEEGACLKTADGSPGANDLLAQCGSENMVDSSMSISMLSTQDQSLITAQIGQNGHVVIRQDTCDAGNEISLLNTQDESASTAQVGQSSHVVIRQDTCDSGNEISPEHKSPIGPEVASNKLQDPATHVKPKDNSTSRNLEVLTCVVESAEVDSATAGDVNSEDANVEVLTCAVDTLGFSKLALGEKIIIEKDNASAGDEDCLLAAGLFPSKMCPSFSSSIRSPISQVRALGDDSINGHCNEDNTNPGISFEVKSLCHIEDVTASSECQFRGYTVEKDGGSSMDSTAGTGWKLQGLDVCIATEEEDASSNGGEDSAGSSASMQPSTQQRKKINIHHQFVREIVKIQHDREHDREHAERQIQAQQAAHLAQLGGKSSDVKEQKTNLSETKQLRSETNKISSQKGLKDHGADWQIKESQQKHASRNKKSSLIQAKDGSKIAPHESSEQGREHFLQGRESLGASEHGKTGRGKQQRSMSIYRPPVVRDSLAAVSHEQRNLGEFETSYHQSVSYTLNSSPDSSTSSVSEPRVPIVGSPNVETQAEQCTGIKVTFDTQKKMRHIEFSDGPDLSRGQRPIEQVSLSASHSSSGSGVSKSPTINPLLSRPFQDSKSSSVTSSNIGKRQVGIGETPSKGNPLLSHPFQDSKSSSVTSSSSGKRQVGIGETPSKGNDRYFTQADRSSWLQGCSPTDFSQSRGQVVKPSDNNVEKKSTFFEQADNGAILHNSNSWSHNSTSSLVRHGINDGRSGQNIYCDSVRHPDGHTGDMRMPSALLQGFSTSSSRKAASLGPSYKGELLSATSFTTPHVRSNEPNRVPMNRQVDFHSQQFKVSGLQHETRGKQRLATSTDESKKKRDAQLRNSIKESGSPFQAMMKDMNRPQLMFSSPAPQTSADASLDFQGFGMSWNGEDHTRTHSQDNSQESMKRSQSDASRRISTQNLQAQLSPLPSRESVFGTMPMREKWGDIVDDLSDTYDYLQGKGEKERESHSGSLYYEAHNQSSAVFIDSATEKPIFRDSKQDKVLRKYGYKETDSFQANNAASELMQEHSAYRTPVRKSVFERLGPQNYFKESILGPPPKVLDSRGVLKASPDTFVSNVPPMSTYKSFDSGFHGSQQASHLSSMLHDSGDNIGDEGREVVQAYTEMKQRRSKRELYVPRRGS